ncbi:MAG: NAD(P)-dependent oxidoreductase [Acidobacteriota bacterium]
MSKPRIGFIGLGIMGQPMAENLLRAGYSLTVHNRTRDREEPLASQGASRAASPAEVAARSDVVISIVPDTPDVETVILGTDGVLEQARPRLLVIDMSTISPQRARDMARALEAKGAELLDAPVTGGDVGAKEGTLTIMVGGNREAFEAAVPIFKAMGKRVHHVGPSGAGQSLKLCNQILCAANMIGLCEALSLGSQSGLDLDQFLEVLGSGAGGSWALSHLGPSVVKRQLGPAFMVRLMQKDLSLAQELGKRLGVPLPGTALAQQLFRGLEAHGEADQGTQAMILMLERWGNFKLGDSRQEGHRRHSDAG